MSALPDQATQLVQVPVDVARLLDDIANDLAGLRADVADIKAKVEQYEPLIEQVRARADRGLGWRRGRGGDDGRQG